MWTARHHFGNDTLLDIPEPLDDIGPFFDDIRPCNSVRDDSGTFLCVIDNIRPCNSVRDDIGLCNSVRDDMGPCNSVRDDIGPCNSVIDNIRPCNSVRDAPVKECLFLLLKKAWLTHCGGLVEDHNYNNEKKKSY